MDSEKLHLVALSMIDSVGPVLGRNLIAALGSAEKIFRTPKGLLMKVPGIGEKTATAIKGSDALPKAERELQFCTRRKIEILSFCDPSYPDALANTYDAPLILFKKGPINLNEKPAVAIVGTRRATDYGREITRIFAKALSSHGFNIVSGMALGIDAEAHKQTLTDGGATTAVLAHGLDKIYPAVHFSMAREISESGAVLSEFRKEVKPDRCNFPARNRIISGLSQAVIVIEAAEKGGALITARKGFDQDRLIFAIPGAINAPASIGCNQLIRDNIARLVTSPEEVIEELGLFPGVSGNSKVEIEQRPRQLELLLSPIENSIVRELESGTKSIDEMSLSCNLTISELLPLLLAMEFKSIVKQKPGKMYELQ